MGKQWKQWLTLFFWAPKLMRMVIAAMKLKDAYSLEEKVSAKAVANALVVQSLAVLLESASF